MRLARFIIISFVVLFLLLTAVATTIPSHVRISRAKQLHVPADSIAALLRDPLAWKKWMPGMDSATPLITNGEVKGLIYDTKKNQSLVIDSQTATTIDARYEGLRRRAIRTGWMLLPDSTKYGTTVQWYMEFELGWYPWEKFSSLLFEKQYGPSLEKGLQNLAAAVEK